MVEQGVRRAAQVLGLVAHRAVARVLVVLVQVLVQVELAQAEPVVLVLAVRVVQVPGLVRAVLARGPVQVQKQPSRVI